MTGIKKSNLTTQQVEINDEAAQSVFVLCVDTDLLLQHGGRCVASEYLNLPLDLYHCFVLRKMTDCHCTRVLVMMRDCLHSNE